jgi:hypothetical protein
VYVPNEQPLETIFVFMVQELKVKGIDADKCIIVCQTRKQCSLIYRMFQVALGSINFLNDSTDKEVPCWKFRFCENPCCQGNDKIE